MFKMELVKDEHVQCIRGGYYFVSVSPKLMLQYTGLSTTHEICRPIIGAVAAFCKNASKMTFAKGKTRRFIILIYTYLLAILQHLQTGTTYSKERFQAMIEKDSFDHNQKFERPIET